MIKCRQQQISSNNQESMMSKSNAITTSRQRRKKSDDDDDVLNHEKKRQQAQEILKKLETSGQVNCSYPSCMQRSTSCCCCQQKKTYCNPNLTATCQERLACQDKCLERNSKQQVAPSCVKCQLIVKWTKAQAELARKVGKGKSSRKEKGACISMSTCVKELNKPAHSTKISSICSESEENDEDKWSVWSEDKDVEQAVTGVIGAETVEKLSQNSQTDEQANQQQQHSRILSFRRRRLALKLAPLGLRKRRPAPMPPTGAARWFKKAPDSASSDSGHTSGHEGSSLHGDEMVAELQIKPKRSGDTTSKSPKGTQVQNLPRSGINKPSLLSEAELFSMEHFLRSHKSAVYVCGCMANLYLTNTKLVDNGRYSRPTADNWQLTKTGVPVLTFDSGLTKNRQRRRLTINLAERGSGFVLWSDIIDHLSNYRAYSARLHGQFRASSSSEKSINELPLHLKQVMQEPNQAAYDTFHVMYLSSNHRLMVGLSFDDAICARLFLKQIELITSDPANISLTGPKLALKSSNLKDTKLNQCFKSTTSLFLYPCARKLPVQVKSQTSMISNKSKHIDSNKAITHDEAEPSKQIGSKENKPHLSASSDQCSSWSTLKRAIRLRRFRVSGSDDEEGGKGSVMQALDKRKGRRKKSSSSTGAQEKQVVENELSEEQRVVAAACQPRPLAELAASGREYRAGRKLPRKCDISAPCLFQHVARVDLSDLERLYSGSLVGTPTSGPTETERTGVREEASSTGSKGNQHSKCATPQELPMSHEGLRAADPDTPQCNLPESEGVAHSSSSCYSSAGSSISDCGRGSRQPRPLPPVRGNSGPEAQSGQSGSSAGGPRIQAIIRELQAQSSSELVDAKRKLMADIVVQARTVSSHL